MVEIRETNPFNLILRSKEYIQCLQLVICNVSGYCSSDIIPKWCLFMIRYLSFFYYDYDKIHDSYLLKSLSKMVHTNSD